MFSWGYYLNFKQNYMAKHEIKMKRMTNDLLMKIMVQLQKCISIEKIFSRENKKKKR